VAPSSPVVLSVVGAVLDLPGFVLDLSVFRHLAPVPARSVACTASSAMLGAAAFFAIARTVSYSRRDLASPVQRSGATASAARAIAWSSDASSSFGTRAS
jgi:hypothetical protein